MWKPISEYPITPDTTGVRGPIVLARDKDKTPYLVMLVEGKFMICPGVPLYYGSHQCGWTYASHVTEFMEIPA